MLLQATHLTFGEIATRWARENAAHPGALDHDQILERFEGGLRRNEFPLAEMTVWQAKKYVSKDNKNYVPQPANWIPVTHDVLDYHLFRTPDAFSKRFLEELRTSQNGFRQWCNDQGFSLPEFWPILYSPIPYSP